VCAMPMLFPEIWKLVTSGEEQVCGTGGRW